MPTYKSPDVYIEEISLLPPSVAEVSTAIPAFIGYTERAERKGVDLTCKALRITSLLEYRQYFGGEPDLKQLNAEVVLNEDGSFSSAKLTRRFYLFDSLRLYFDNGGGPCYIVSAGRYEKAGTIGTIDKVALLDGLNAVRKEDEPTLLVMPEAICLEDDDRAEVHQKMLTQCEELQDRFALLDVKWEAGERDARVRQFRNGVGMRALKYGAAYYPYVRTTLPADLRYEHITFKQKGKDKDANGIAIAVKVDGLSEAATGADPEDRSDAVKQAAQRLDDALTDRNALRAALDHADSSTVALSWPDWFRKVPEADLHTEKGAKHQLDVVWKLAEKLGGQANTLKSTSLMEVATNLTRPEGPLGLLVKELRTLDLAWEKVVAGQNALGVVLDNFLGKPIGVKPEEITQQLREGLYGTGPLADAVKKAGAHFKRIFEAMHPLLTGLEESANSTVEVQEAAARAQHPVLQNAFDELGRMSAEMPPSGAIAGVCAYVDGTRGVWKAPANVSLSSVVGPVELLDTRDQENLNVDVDAGKSINALRAFAGKGTLVWGARTLAGNDNEWRYVPVRRFFNMVEESVKKSTAWAVFEPNDANTWVRVKSMIENYLTQKWRDGALAGPRPVDAFFVKIGLGSTMTPQDILEGRMFVEIGMAVVRPAEFIILRFSHKLQTA